MIQQTAVPNFEEALKLLMGPPSDDMTLLYDLPEIKAWKFSDPETGNMVIKYQGSVAIPVEHFGAMLTGPYRLHWHPNYHDYQVIEDDKQGSMLIYWGIKTPVMVTNRDFVCRRTQIENFEGFDLAFFMNSEETPKKPKREGYVRAKIFNTYNFVRRGPNNTSEFFMNTSIDFGGVIPSFIVNS